MNPTVAIAVTAAMLVLPAKAAEVKLVCEDTSESAQVFRKNAPSLGIDIFAVDLSARRVRQLAGELKDKKVLSVEVSEADIQFVQSGYISQPTLVETFRTTISRVSGKWVRYPHYENADGKWLTGEPLEATARSLNLWGPFGVRQRADEGECKLDDRKF